MLLQDGISGIEEKKNGGAQKGSAFFDCTGSYMLYKRIQHGAYCIVVAEIVCAAQCKFGKDVKVVQITDGIGFPLLLRNACDLLHRP